jgi:hypothetical protein
MAKAKKKTKKAPGNKAVPVPSEDMEKYRAEEDLRTLRRFIDIKRNPKRLGSAMQMLDDELNAMSHVKSLQGHIMKSRKEKAIQSEDKE